MHTDGDIVVEVQAAAHAPELDPETLTLAALLAPITPEQFSNEHVRREALAARGGGAARAAALYPEAAAGDVEVVDDLHDLSLLGGVDAVWPEDLAVHLGG